MNEVDNMGRKINFGILKNSSREKQKNQNYNF
jgi:hypothetical protein